MQLSPDTNPRYWLEYSNLQKTKHDLIKYYLGGWFPKLGYWSGRIIYFDTHAGRGRHKGGELGSPLVAIKTLLEHTYRDELLRRCEVVFFFIERDHSNLETLNQEIKAFGPLPSRVRVKTVAADCFTALNSLLALLQEKKMRLAPALLFVDPYGFKVPGRILHELMRFPRVELLVNVIWRELDMAIRQGLKPGMAETLNLVFDGDEWRNRIMSPNFDERADQAVNLLREKIGARWATYVRMLGVNGATRYLLLHLTNHDDGRDLMKDCVWRISPAGGFYVRKSDDPTQQFLITPEPNLTPLREWVLKKLALGPARWQSLLSDLRGEIWRAPHLRIVLRELRNEGLLQSEGKFTPSADPILRIGS
jgi:three-Cys-motif partner protein